MDAVAQLLLNSAPLVRDLVTRAVQARYFITALVGFYNDDMSENNADGEASSAETEEFDRDQIYWLAEQKTRTGRRNLE